MFHAMSPRPDERDDGEFACGLPYFSGRRQLYRRGASLALCGSEDFCSECVHEVATHCTLTTVDETEWFDEAGQWGTCKHYRLPDLLDLAGGTPTFNAQIFSSRQRTSASNSETVVGYAHAFPSARSTGRRAARHKPLAPAEDGMTCSATVHEFVSDEAPTWTKKALPPEQTCPTCFANVASGLTSGVLRPHDVQWRDEAGVEHVNPAALQQHVRNNSAVATSGSRSIREEPINTHLRSVLRKRGAELLAQEKRTRADS